MTGDIKIHYKWNGMCCKKCHCYNSAGVCDFNGPQDENNYCKRFIPHPAKNTKSQILDMWHYHQQRFIIERQ